MKAWATCLYVALFQIWSVTQAGSLLYRMAYKTKAQQDIESVTSRVERLLLDINKPYDFIDVQLVKLFCKNSYFLQAIRYRSLEEECDPQTSKIDSLIGIRLEKK